MALSVNPLTHVIFVPRADLTLVSGTIYKHDTDAFRLELKSWEDSAEGICQPKTHDHNTTVTVAGVTYARAIVMLAPYSIEYEDGQYSVILEGSNNNIFDVENGILVQNQVQVIPTNSAGLVVADTVNTARLNEMWQLLGLDASNPLDVTDVEQKTGDITLEINDDGTKTTVTRQ